MARRLSSAFAFVLLAACTSGAPTPGERSAPVEATGAPAELIAVPAQVSRECEEALRTLAACPAAFPTVDGRYQARSFEVEGTDHDVVDISFSAPYPRLSRRNAPPRFAHVVIRAGDRAAAAPFEIPSEVESTLPRRIDDVAVNLGDHTWGTKDGTLVLAPAFPTGGIDGGHLMFLWEEAGTTVALSLHAWVPLDDAIATLRDVVRSIE